MNQYAELKQHQQDSQQPKDAAGSPRPHSYEWYVIENINDPDKRIDHILPLDEAIPLYAASDCGDKRLGVTKDDIAAVDLVIRWNGREWLSEDRLKLDSFKHDPVVADACTRLQQMLEAVPGIRFVDSHNRDLFRLTDGDCVRITAPDGSYEEWVCRYIDETHMECGLVLYHICDFAEQMEKAGNTVIPLRSSLPEKCFAALETTSEIVVIHRGVKGYTPTRQRPEGVSGQEGADALNEQLGVSKAQATAMLAGSMFGWACPGADPANYDGQGRPIKPQARQED